MIDACASLSRKAVQFFTLSSVWIVSWLAAENAHDQAEMHRAYTNVMWLRGHSLSSTNGVGFGWHDGDRLLYEAYRTQFLPPASRYALIALSGVWRVSLSVITQRWCCYQNSPVDYIWNKTMAGLMTVTVRAGYAVYASLGTDSLPSFTNSKSLWPEVKFQPGFVNRNMMSPTTRMVA